MVIINGNVDRVINGFYKFKNIVGDLPNIAYEKTVNFFGEKTVRNLTSVGKISYQMGSFALLSNKFNLTAPWLGNWSQFAEVFGGTFLLDRAEAFQAYLKQPKEQKICPKTGEVCKCEVKDRSFVMGLLMDLFELPKQMFLKMPLNTILGLLTFSLVFVERLGAWGFGIAYVSTLLMGRKPCHANGGPVCLCTGGVC